MTSGSGGRWGFVSREMTSEFDGTAGVAASSPQPLRLLLLVVVVLLLLLLLLRVSKGSAQEALASCFH